MNLVEKVDYKVKGYTGRWTMIDKVQGYGLLEHNTYGDETCYLVVRVADNVEEKQYTLKSTGEKVTLPTVLEVLCETFDGLEVALEDEGIIVNQA